MEKLIKNKGITLVALVIIIIILVILAGVAITALTQTGLFENAKQAKNAMENAEMKENDVLSSYENKVNELTGEIVGSRDENAEFKELVQEKINKLRKHRELEEIQFEDYIGTKM